MKKQLYARAYNQYQYKYLTITRNDGMDKYGTGNPLSKARIALSAGCGVQISCQKKPVKAAPGKG